MINYYKLLGIDRKLNEEKLMKLLNRRIDYLTRKKGKANGEDKIYTVISEALAKQGYEIERKRIEIPGLAIKSVGNYHATVKLYEAAVAEIKIAVKAQSGAGESVEKKDAPAEEKKEEAKAE